MKKVLISFLLVLTFVAQAQNKKILYGFDNIPQGLLLNPGQENPYRSHIGIPVLSGLSFDANISGITVASLFGDDGIGGFAGTDFNTKVQNALNTIGYKDYASVNAQVEVLSGGYKLNDRDYLSFGFYEEADGFFGFPKDLFDLLNEGNAGNNNENIDRVFSASGIAFRAEVLGVLHAGITRRINNVITVGARAKIYSGGLNITSNNNQGTFVTTRTPIDQNGIYASSFNNLDGSLLTSGIYDEDAGQNDVTRGKVIGNTFIGGNLGLGIDIGLTYHVNEQIELTASLLDVGFVNYRKNIRNNFLKGDFTYSGINLEYSEQRNYLQELEDEFNEGVYREVDSESYTVLRPVKFNSSARYSFGKSRYLSTCHDIRLKDYYDNAVGAQLYAVSRPYGIRMALTGFYERKFADFLNTKITWTVDDFSSTNVGLGVSTNIWKLNVYGMLDNIFELTDITDANTFSAQFGINLIFN